MTQQEISKRCYMKRKENGLCPKCGGEKDREGHYCKTCLEKYRERNRGLRQFYQSIGICPHCRKAKLFGDEKVCLECGVKIANNRKPPTEEQRKRYNAQHNAYKKSLYQERAEQGICTRCGKIKAMSGRKKCGICLEKDAIAQRKRRGVIIPAYERVSFGLCYFCGEKLDRDGRTCQKCAKKMTSNLPEVRGGNDYWKADNNMVFKKSV